MSCNNHNNVYNILYLCGFFKKLKNESIFRREQKRFAQKQN